MSQERDHDRPPPGPPFDPTPHASEPKPDRVRRERPSGVPAEPHDRCSPPSRRSYAS